MEAETNSPEDASSVSAPLIKSIKNIGSEVIIFPQKHGNDVNSKYPLVEEKGKADSSKTDEVSETRPQEIHQESCKVSVGSEKQAEVPSGWSKQRDSEGHVMMESIPESSIKEQRKVPGEHEDEHMSTIPELAINPTEMAVKISEEETYKEEEELTAIDNDQSCMPENELEQTSKALEVIDQTQFTGKDTADNEHANHQLEEPSTENVITKHSNSEQFPTESSIKSKCDEEPLEKILELYSVDNSEIKKDGKVMSEKEIGVPVDGTMKTLSTTACVGAAELENKDEGEFTLEKAKEMEAATDSPPENKDQPAVSTSEFVKGHTDEISQQQTHKNDETPVIDTEKSSTEPEDDDKLYKEAKEIEAAMETQLVNTETESLPKEQVQPRLLTPDIVQQNTDQIIKQQPLNQDQPDMIDNAQSYIAEKEPDRLSTVIEEPVELETKHNISLLKEQANQQSEETSMQNVTTNYIIEGHVTSESSIKVADDVHKSDSIKNLEKKDENEIREEEATDVKQSTNVEIPKREAKGRSEDKALQTLPSAELVGNKANDECFQGDIKPEAGLAVTYANEKQALQHEFDTKEEIPEEEACKLIAESEAKSEPQIVAQNNETTCIKHPYLDGETSEINPTNDIIEQEITMSHAKEKLAIEDDKNFNLEKEKGTEKETNMQLEDTTESEPKEEPIQPIARAELVRTKAHDESSLEANVTVKSNKEVQTSNVIEKEEIQDTGKCSQVEEKTIKEPTKSQLKEEEVQTRSPTPPPTPPSVQGDTNQIRQQETLYIDESEINDNDKQGCIPKIAQDIQLTIAQETEKPETKVSVGIVTEKLDNKHASEIRSEEGTDAKQLTDVEIPKSEIEGVPKEAQQPIANTVLVGTRVYDEGCREDTESEEDAKVLSNDEEQKPEYVTEGTVGIKATNYTIEKEEVPTSPVSVKEGIENIRKFIKEEESKRVKEETKMQLQDEQGQTRSPTPAFVQGDTNKIPQQETLCIDESEAFDNAKQWCIPAIELEKNTTVAQETRNPETKDKVNTVAENLGHKDVTEIKAEEGTYAQQSTEVEMPKSERDGMPIDEAQQPIANAVSVRSKALEESSQEIPPKAYVKSNKEVKTPESVTNEVVEISTTNYTEKQDVPKAHVGEGERIGDKFNQEKEEGIEATNTQLLEEEVQIRSSTLVSVQGDTNQIPQQETLHVNESEVIENAIVVQEWEVSETQDNAGTIIENLDKDASEIRGKDGTEAKQFTDLEMSKSETEEEIQDNRKFNQREEEIKIDEVTGMQTPQEEVHTTSPTPTFVKSHTDITQEQQAFHFKESNVIATAKQSCIPEFAHDRNPTAVQEIEVFEIKHNVNRVMENLDKEETEIIENEKTDTTQLNEESDQQDKQLEADITDKSNTKVQTPGYLTDENVEINITDYAEEKNQNPTHHAKEKEGIEDIFKQEEKEKLIEQTTNTQSEEEEVQTHAPAFVIGDTNQTPHQETMHADESKVMDNAKQSCIPEIELDGKPIVFQETEVSENVKSVIENLDKEETEIRENEKTDTTQLNEESGEQDKQLEADITDKSNKKVQTPEYVTDENVEINITDYAEEKNQNPTDHAKEKEGIEDIFKQEEKEKLIEQTTNTQSEEEEVQTHGPAFVIGDTNQIPHQETMHGDESKVIDNTKQISIPEIELDGKASVFQETEVSENVNRVIENLDKEETEIRENEKTDTTQLNDESGEQDKQLEADITDKSNKKVQTPEYVTDENVEINITDYAEEKNQNPTHHAKEKEGIEDIFKQAEKEKLIEETTNTQSEEEEVQTHGPASVIGDTNQIPYLETMHADESKVMDNAKQSYIPEIELDGKAVVFQETEVSESLYKKDATEIRVKKEIDAKKLTDSEMPKPKIEEDGALKPIANAELVRTEAVEESGKQETQQKKDITEETADESNKEVLIKKFAITEKTAEINTNNCTKEHDTVETSPAKEQEGTGDGAKLHEEKANGIEEKTKTQNPEEEFQTSSPTPAFVQGDSGQTLQQETVKIDESEVLDNDKHRSIPEIELDGKSTVVQETNNPEIKDNISTGAEDLDNKDAIEVQAEEGAYVKQLTNVEIPNSEIKDTEVPEDEVPQPIEVAAAIETVDDINQKEIKIEEDITEKKSNKDEQSSQYVATDTTEIKTNSYTDEHDKVQTSHAEVNQGTEGDENFGQVEEAKGNEETNKVQLPEEEVQIRSPTPAFVQGDTDQISQQELLLVDEPEVIDYVEQSCIPEIELDRKSTVVQETEKPETKNNVSIVTENLGTNDASEIIAKEETDAEKLADVKIVKSEIKGVPKDETLKPTANAVLLRTEAVEKNSQQDKQQEAEVSDKSIKEVQSQEYITEGSAEININNEAEEKDKNSTSNAEKKEGTSHAEEKEGIEDIFNQKEKEKEIEEATKTHSVEEEEIQRRSPPPGFVQGDTNQILHQETLHINESEVIHNAKLSYIPEIELHEKAIVVQKSEKVETKDNFDRVRENLNKDESENRAEEGIDVNQLTDLEMPKSETKGVLEDDSLQPMPDTVSVEKEAVSVSQEKRQPQEEFIKKVNKEVQTPQYFTEDREKIETTNDTEEQEEVPTSQPKEKSGNKDDDKFEQEEEKIGIEESTKTQLQDKDISTTIGEPEDKALITRLNSSSNGNEGLDEISPEKFTENLNKDVQTPQRNTKANTETNITSYPDKLEEAEDIEESIEKQLAEEEIQHTLPTPTSVQEDIDQMSQQQTLHDDEIEVISNAKSCMTEIELDRKSIVVEESKQPETKANDDLVKEEQADHQSKESRDQSFITNYIIVERHTTSESNKELSDDVDLDGQKKLESHLEEFLEIKDASEIRAKGIHSKQLTDVEIKKSETEGVAEDKGMQTMSSTSVKNYAINECCQEEIQPREEYAETHIKEVKMPHYEFNMQKHIPEVYGVEEDTCQTRVVNEQKLESQLASLNKEATFIDNRYSDGEIENANAISDIEKEVNPKSHTKQKLVIHDSIFNEEEAKGIEEMTKIKLLNSATDCPPEEEVQPKLPDPATVQGDTDQILQQQTLPSDALDTIDNNLRSIPENELDRMSTSVEEPETKANINIVEEKSDKQSHEPSMQSLITDYITAEGHLASENSSKLSYDKKEQKTVNLQMVENLGIMYASKTTTEEVTDAKQPTGVELEKTKNEELIENKTLDESNQEEMQPEEDFSETYTKGKKTPQSSMENVNSEGMEITENSSKSSYAEEEQEQVINTYTIENSEIKDSRIIKLEEASDIKEATDESVDKAISFLSTIPSVRIGIVDESIQEKIQKDVQPAVINSKAEQRPENDFVRNMEVLEGPGNTSVENDEKVEVQSEANNQKTIKKHPNLEELETAEISPSSDTKELGKEREVAKLGGVSESVSVDITEHIDTGKLETQEAETGTSGNTKEGEEFEKISPSSSVGVISRDSQDSGTKVLHKKSHGILSGVGSKVKHSISKVKKVITGKSSHPKTPPS